jgi:hypothetical protein
MILVGLRAVGVAASPRSGGPVARHLAMSGESARPIFRWLTDEPPPEPHGPEACEGGGESLIDMTSRDWHKATGTLPPRSPFVGRSSADSQATPSAKT